ncbi:MAG: single-stranded DNA-binding protein [Trueperaceae bacterium]
MALGLNQALLIGTLVREPDLRYTPAGLAVLRLDLAGDDHLHDEDGTVRARPWYHRVTVFGVQAERVVDHVRTGTPLWVEGHLEQRAYETDDGDRRTTLDLVGRRVEILGLGARDPSDPFAVDARDQPRLRDAVNVVRLIGNLTRDVDVRRTEQGHALARFAVAVQERGDAESGPHFVEAQAWRDLARGCEGLSKGDPVFVEGRLTTDAWTDGEGRRRFATRVELLRLERIERLPRRGDPAPPPAAEAEAGDGAGDGTGEQVPF